MDDPTLGRLVRVLRHRRGWRQDDLARRAGVGRTAVGDLERGQMDGMRLTTVRRILTALGLSVEAAVRGLGADLDRLLDARHAVLVGSCARWLGRSGWETRSEVSYSEWGERGSIDLLAWHAASRTLLVIEVKTELASVEATLRKHDEKVRLAAKVALQRCGWPAMTVARLLVLPADRTQRRRVARHAAVLDGVYPDRSTVVRRWCRSPDGSLDGLVFLTDVAGGDGTFRRGRRERVRPARSGARRA